MQSAGRFALCAAPLAWLWFVLLDDLRGEWTVNPQYSYGWAVPFLCVFLIVQNLKSESRNQKSETHFRFQFLFALLALLYAPTRLIQEANPGWRFVSWALALEVIGITFCALRMVSGTGRWAVGAWRFPLLFFLVAVPWPTVVESPLIQALTRLDVAATCELTGWLGIPAVPHGNVIEVATGRVGVDEACSGIRSFQATLMISLFLGAFYELGTGRRVVCVFAGFALALLLNLGRLLVLVWVAATRGVPAIAQWHDPTGVVILLGCFCGLWALGAGLARKKSPKPENNLQPSTFNGTVADESQKPESGNVLPCSAFPISASALIAWLVLVEAGVEGWYRWHEARLPAAVTWQVDWPTNNPTFKEQQFAEDTRRLLRFSDGRNVAWQEDGLGWQVFFLHWQPGRTAVRLAQNHTPEVCLAAAGHKLAGGDREETLAVHSLRMPFRFYRLTDTPQPVFVAYCLWDDRASARHFETSSLTYGNRLAPVLAGRRNSGQRSIELVLAGADDPAAARAAVQSLLEKIISPDR